MSKRLKVWTAGVLAVLFFLMVPVPACRADDDSNLNKGALIGLFLVVVGVLLWVGFRSDVESRHFADFKPRGETLPYGFPMDGRPSDVIELGRAPFSFSAEGIGLRF